MTLYIKENIAGICLAIILLIFIIRGLRKGLIAMAAAVASIVFTLAVSREITPRVIAYLGNKGILYKISEWFSSPAGRADAETQHSGLYEILGLQKIADAITGTVTEIVIRIILFIALFLLIRIIIKLVIGILKGIKKINFIDFFDRLFGAIVGLIEGLFWSWTVIAVIVLADIEAAKLQMAMEMSGNALMRFVVNNNLILEFIREFIR